MAVGELSGPEPAGADPDVLVIGAGAVGLYCAYFLRLNGARVTVLERGPVGGPQSCSWGNTGFVGTQGAAPLAEPGVLSSAAGWLMSSRSPLKIKPRPSVELASWLWQFARRCNEKDARRCYGLLLELKKRSLEIMRELAAGPAGFGSVFDMPGMVVAYRTEQGFDRAVASVPRAVAGGVPLRVLSPGDLRALEPGAEFDVCGALLNEEGAMVRAPEFVLRLAELARQAGVRVLGGTEVTGFERAAGRVTCVRTGAGDLRPAEIVVAAGSWSAGLVKMLGRRLALQPAKGYSVTAPALSGAPRRPVLLSEGKVALAPLGDQVRLGGTLELGGLDSSVSRRRVAAIIEAARSYLPGLKLGAEQDVWSGLRPCTPDSLPYLGRLPEYQNVSLASGHGYIGLGLAPVSGRLIAQVIAGQQPELDLTPFRADRFR